MRIEPTEQKEWWQARSFGANKIYQRTVKMSSGKCIEGGTTARDYFVYVEENPVTKAIKHKLYVVNDKNNKWLKSFLRFFKKDQLSSEVRSQTK